MSRRLSLLLGFLIATTVCAQEIPLTAPAYGPAPDDQYGPAVASNGVDFLSAWLDSRGGFSTLYAARVRAGGAVLDDAGIRIATFDGLTANTRLLGVFRMSGAYVVLFATQRLRPGGAAQPETCVARVGDDGRLIGPVRVLVEETEPYIAASNGSRILVVYPGSLTLLNDRGDILQENIPLPEPGLFAGAIVSNGSSFLVLASRTPTDSILFLAFDANGAMLGSSSVPSRLFGTPIAGSDGAGYLVLYKDGSSTATQTRVVTAGGTLSTAGTIPRGDLSTVSGTLLWTGSSYLLASNITDGTQELAAAALTRNGAMAGTPRRLGISGASGSASPPAAAWNGSRALFALPAGTQTDARGSDIAGVLADGAASPVTPPVTISNSATLQMAPAIGSGSPSGNDLVAWLEPGGVYAARVLRDGTVLDPGGLPIAPGAVASRELLHPGNFVPPRVVLDGLAYVVMWANATGLYAQRIDAANGVLIGTPQTLLNGCVLFFDVGRDAGGLAVFASTCSGLVAQRVGMAGVVGAPVALPLPQRIGAGSVAAAWNGAEWLVVVRGLISLSPGFSPPSTRGSLLALRLSPALTPLDAQPIGIGVPDTDEQAPLVATNGADFFVTWTRWREAVTVRGRVVHAGGSTDEPLLLAADGSTAAAMVWDGARYAIALATPSGAGTGIYRLWLTHAGSGDRVPISAAPTAQPRVALAAVPGASLRAVYDRTAPEPQYGGVWRVFLRDIAGGRRRVTTSSAVVP